MRFKQFVARVLDEGLWERTVATRPVSKASVKNIYCGRLSSLELGTENSVIKLKDAVYYVRGRGRRGGRVYKSSEIALEGAKGRLYYLDYESFKSATAGLKGRKDYVKFLRMCEGMFS